MAKLKLHYLPGACSLAAHIALREAGLDFDLDKMDRSTPVKKTQSGDDYLQVNPKGQVPVLRLDGQGVLTECAVILQYVADQKPGSGLAPAAGTMERYRLQEWLNFITSEIHKQFSPMFNPATSEEVKEGQRTKLAGRFDWLSRQLEGRQYLMGDQFTVADAYLFTVLRWSPFTGIDLGKWPVLAQYVARVGARPKVQAAMKAEGLS